MSEEKERLLTECKRMVEERITKAQQELKSYDAQSGEETKSSAGDKYETTRAMLHLEKEKIAQQLNESIKISKVLSTIKPRPNELGLGKVIKTDQGSFFIAVGLGAVEISGNSYMVISPVAPLGKLFSQAQKGETVTFNKKSYKIQEVF